MQTRCCSRTYTFGRSHALPHRPTSLARAVEVRQAGVASPAFPGGVWGALYFGLPRIAVGNLGTYLIKPTAGCVTGLMKVSGEELACTTTPDGVAVQLDLGTGSLWIGRACTSIAAWAWWVAFLVALPVGWRARAIALPAGMAALWILDTLRLSSVLLANGAGHYALAKTLHDHVWPWLTALVMIAGTWTFLRGHSAKDWQNVQSPSAKGGERRCGGCQNTW